MIKIIFIYWAQKFINAPTVVKKCLLSWKLKNPTWKIIELRMKNKIFKNLEKILLDAVSKKLRKKRNFK